MRLRDGAASKRVSSRTAEVRAARPAHKPSAPVPMGVTAPTPVITTRRPFFTIPPRRQFFRASYSGLRETFDPRQREARDPVDEHRPDDETGDQRTDQRP